MRQIKILCFFLLLLLSTRALAWGMAGHYLVADLAYDQLPLSVKKKMMLLLDVDDLSLRGEFIKASFWLDEERRNDNHQFDHWHYINLPSSLSQAPHLKKQPSSENVVWAIDNAKRVLSEPTQKMERKKIMLKVLIHLVADIHQPLHCSSSYSLLNPSGDKGGNLFYLNHRAENLHRYWDWGAGWLVPLKRGEFNSDRYLSMRRLLKKKQGKNRAGDVDKSPQRWAVESSEIADISVRSGIEKSAKPSANYERRSQLVVQGQLLKAADRLALALHDAMLEN